MCVDVSQKWLRTIVILYSYMITIQLGINESVTNSLSDRQEYTPPVVHISHSKLILVSI